MTIAFPSQAQLYRWVDDDGNVHYTDTLPPDRARDGRSVFSRDGSRVGEVERAPTPEELAEQEAERLREKERQAREQEARTRQLEYDRMLLRTFNNEAHIERSRVERLEALNASQRQLMARSERDEEELEELRARAAQAERTGRGDPDAIYQRIRRVEERLASRDARAAELDQAMNALDQEYDNHLARFRELQEERQ
ncbi:MAG: DUF4124 domain-containing protein [Ectothiorhodospiraceae bacterium]|nr:DUF4124 domain-containing protein [Ectothiorhodospiraceae bacterium]MCH8507012.1 DUF4124 domain-containing protein [Ectothiorhodospiraceae bacterium]